MILTAVLFILFAVLIKTFKFYDLIAGYNTMSDDKKATYNIEKIAALFAYVMYFMTAIILIGYGFSEWLNNEQIGFYTIMAATFLGVPYILFKSNSKAYKNKSKEE